MRGQVRFKAGEAEYSLHYTTNRLCALEEETGKSVFDFAAQMSGAGKMSIRDVRLLMRVGLDATDDLAGDVIDAIGLTEAVALINRAIAAAFDIDPVKAEGARGKPKAGAA